jgi:hypothetical protein
MMRLPLRLPFNRMSEHTRGGGGGNESANIIPHLDKDS